METLSGAEIRAMLPLLALFCLGPVFFGFIILLPAVLWRRFIFNPRRRGTFEGDLAYLARKRRERMEEWDRRRRAIR